MADKELVYCVMDDNGRVLYVCKESEYDHYFKDVLSIPLLDSTGQRKQSDSETNMTDT